MRVHYECDGPLCGYIEVSTYWYAFGFAWHLEVQLWGMSKTSLHLGPMQLYCIDLGRVATMEAVLEMKYAARSATGGTLRPHAHRRADQGRSVRVGRGRYGMATLRV